MVMLARIRKALAGNIDWDVSLKNDLLEICRLYKGENLENRHRGLRWAERIGGANWILCHQRANEYLASEGSKMFRIRKAIELRKALSSPLAALFRSILQNVPVGLGMLLDIRKDVGADKSQKFPIVDFEITSLLEVCLNPGLLQLQPVFQSSDLSIKQSVANVEALYPFQSESDYGVRFGAGRRVFALIHPALRNSPLTVLYIALVDSENLPTNIEDVLSGRYKFNDSTCDTAVCYSISNGHQGASRFGLAGWTIKKAIQMLRTEFPGLKSVLTLSPIPGLIKWLKTENSVWCEDILRTALDDPSILDSYKAVIIKKCLRYLALEKDANEASLDPVFRFHTHNGARLADIHWGADLSRRGIMNSFGMMCQYEYRIDGESFENHISISIREMLSTSVAKSNEA